MDYTKSAKNAIKEAKKVAARLEHEYVGSEHLLFGLLKEKQGLAGVILENNGIDANKIFVTGIPVGPAFLQKYDRNEVCKKFSLDPNKRVILLFGGGEYGLSNVKQFLTGLLEVEEDIQECSYYQFVWLVLTLCFLVRCEVLHIA